MIRRAAAADLPAVRDCAARAYGRYVAAIGRKPAPMVADFAAQIAAGEVHVDVGEDGGLRGFVVFRPEGEAMLLENVAVLPAAAGRGIGGALIRFCEAEALARGLATVRLYTNEKMTENLLIYPRLGYAEVARRREDGFDRVFFEKRLPRQG
jgi:ribosomal protein S18 acetylase RimI-like enzyme